MPPSLEPRELARCGLFGAAALLLPVLFHLVRLGHVFMPMYLPLVALAFLARPGPAALTALVTPLISGVATGMPPLYPPVAVCMAVELAAMAALIGVVSRRWPRLGVYPVLLPVLVLGRALHVALVYLFACLLELPAGFLAGLSLLAGWPGLLLMVAVIPPLVRLARGSRAEVEVAR
jgi:hypothetical protein